MLLLMKKSWIFCFKLIPPIIIFLINSKCRPGASLPCFRKCFRMVLTAFSNLIMSMLVSSFKSYLYGRSLYHSWISGEDTFKFYWWSTRNSNLGFIDPEISKPSEGAIKEPPSFCATSIILGEAKWARKILFKAIAIGERGQNLVWAQFNWNKGGNGF